MSDTDRTGPISRLRRLHRMTTPGDWWKEAASRPTRDASTYVIAAGRAISGSNDPNVGEVVFALQDPRMRGRTKATDDEVHAQGEANIAFICAAKNDLPAVIEAIDALTARVQELEVQNEALSKARDAAETQTTTLEAALIGSDADVPTVWRIGWLRMLLDECRRPEVHAALSGDDPASCTHMLDQVQILYDDASGALSDRTQIAVRDFGLDSSTDEAGTDHLNGR